MQQTETNPYSTPPTFTRGQLAKILGCSPLTISNQEKKGTFPPPRRKSNGYRSYSLTDVLLVQLQYLKEIQPAPIYAVLWNMGYTSGPDIKKWIQDSLEEVRLSTFVVTEDT